MLHLMPSSVLLPMETAHSTNEYIGRQFHLEEAQ
jgi:hypothetical protein